MRFLPVLLVVALGSDKALAQGVPERKLGAPLVEFDAELTTVSAIRELADGRVILLDVRDKTVYLLDPRSGSASRIGREGSGPGEYLRPGELHALPGDTTLIADFGNTRYLVLGSDARILGTMPLVQLQPTPGVTYSLTVRYIDAAGRMYFTLPRGMVADLEKGTPVLRFDRRAQRYDTVGTLMSAATSSSPAQQVGRGGARFGIGAPAPFVAADDFSVAADGSIAFVRASPYRVDWRTVNGAVTTGPSINYERIKVDDTEKQAWREAARLRGGPTLTTRNAQGQTETQRLPVPEPTSWPEYKAPFNAPASHVAPDGRLWVRRATRAKHPATEYDVFDRAGKLVERVTMPAASTVVGFGKSSIYVARKDEDDVLHLQQHPLVPRR